MCGRCCTLVIHLAVQASPRLPSRTVERQIWSSCPGSRSAYTSDDPYHDDVVRGAAVVQRRVVSAVHGFDRLPRFPRTPRGRGDHGDQPGTAPVPSRASARISHLVDCGACGLRCRDDEGTEMRPLVTTRGPLVGSLASLDDEGGPRPQSPKNRTRAASRECPPISSAITAWVTIHV